jgi:hypothetical protein
VTTPILKLMAELVQNRSQRLTFEISSPNGILLFRESSRLVCAYGSRILQNMGILNQTIQQQRLNQRDGTQLFRQENKPGKIANGKNNSGSDNEIYSLKIKGYF